MIFLILKYSMWRTLVFFSGIEARFLWIRLFNLRFNAGKI
jgi:hypothetical protein